MRNLFLKTTASLVVTVAPWFVDAVVGCDGGAVVRQSTLVAA